MKINSRFKYISLLLLLSFLAVSCSQKSKQTEYTPWGTVMGEENGNDSTHSENFTLDDIVAQGEIIVLTTSGPDTYYDYHGRGMGMHYLLCSKFAEEIGVKVRVELCKDSTELMTRLNNGDGDLVACSLHSESADSCGPGWVASSKELADTIRQWYKPDMSRNIVKEEKQLLATGGVVRHVYAPIINRQKGLISKYDDLFIRYAPTAGLDWKLIAAQCYQESCFDPQAHSWAGARGLMQIMPCNCTYLGISLDDMYTPEPNVRAACKLMGNLMKHFAEISNPTERIAFALAGYNAGQAHIRDAMALARKHGKDPHRWADVQQEVLNLSKREYYTDPVVKYGYMRGSETHAYVRKIFERWQQYGGNPRGLLGPSGGNMVPSTQPSLSTGGNVPHPAKRKNKYDQ